MKSLAFLFLFWGLGAIAQTSNPPPMGHRKMMMNQDHMQEMQQMHEHMRKMHEELHREMDAKAATTTAPRSGSATAARKPMSMQDRDKTLEMCRSLPNKVNCEQVVQDCAGAADRETCVRSYMK